MADCQGKPPAPLLHRACKFAFPKGLVFQRQARRQPEGIVWREKIMQGEKTSVSRPRQEYLEASEGKETPPDQAGRQAPDHATPRHRPPSRSVPWRHPPPARRARALQRRSPRVTYSAPDRPRARPRRVLFSTSPRSPRLLVARSRAPRPRPRACPLAFSMCRVKGFGAGWPSHPRAASLSRGFLSVLR